MQTIIFKIEVSTEPTVGCVSSNIVEGQYSITAEDAKNHVQLSFEPNQDIAYGSCYKLSDVQPIENKYYNPSSFDYEKYMKSKQIVYQAKAMSGSTPHAHPSDFLKTKRDQIIALNCQRFTDVCPYVNTLLFGSNQIDLYHKTIYGQVGIAPIFAISGMHITIIYDLIIYWLSKMRVVITKANGIAIGCLLVYTFMAGSSVAVNRALMMIFCTNGLKLKTSSGLVVSLLISLLYNPFNILNSGYILSYGLTIAIIVLRKPKFKFELLNVLVFSIICYLISFPLAYHFNYTFNLFAPVAMIVFVPLITMCLMPLALVITLVPSDILISITALIIFLINNLAELFNQFTVTSGHLSIITWLLYFNFIANIYFKNYVYIAMLMLWYLAIAMDLNLNPLVTFIDVGQGDSALVETRHDNYLFDVGNHPSEIIKQLKYQGVDTISAVFISHPHLDHYGALSEVSNYIEIDSVYELVNNQIISNSLGIEQPYHDQVFDIIPYYGSNDNDRELVVKITLNGHSILFSGDVEAESEAYLATNYCQEINSDILKVPHHGSRTSSSAEFVDCVSPEIAVISSGRNNMYKLPNQEIVDMYLQEAVVYNTQSDGQIQFKLKSKKMKKTSS